MSAVGALAGYSSIRGTTPGKGDIVAIDDARRALAKANAAVATDQANHSPSCVACDQKLVDQAQLQLAAANTQAQSAGLLDITV